MEQNRTQQNPDPKQHEKYDPRERIRNLAGNEPETHEDDVQHAKAQQALAAPTQDSGSRTHPT